MSTALPVLILAASLAATAAAASPDPLARHRWRDRVLVVAAPEAADAGLVARRRIVEAARAGARERDLVVIEAVGGGADAASACRRPAIALAFVTGGRPRPDVRRCPGGLACRPARPRLDGPAA